MSDADIVPLCRLWASEVGIDKVDLTDREVADALRHTLLDAADEVDRLRDVGAEMLAAARTVANDAEDAMVDLHTSTAAARFAGARAVLAAIEAAVQEASR